MKYLAAIIAFYLGCLAAVALGQPTAEMTQAIVRIRCGSSAGSGCLVGKDAQTGLIVTCNHLFNGESALPLVIFPNGQQLQGQIVARDTLNDLAAVAIPTPTAEPVPLANYRPSKGERIFSAGFGSTETNQLAINAGVVEFYADRGDGQFPGIHISGSVRPGDSGGPMFNERGEVAAVLWGGAQGDGVVGTGSAQMTAVLAQCPPGRVCQPYRIQQPQTQPIARPTQPPLAPIPAKPCNCDNATLIARITKLEADLLALQNAKPIPGPPGPEGKQGPGGPAGPAGKDGQPPAIDQIVKQLPPIKFEIWDDGKLKDTRTVPLGGVVPLERYLIGAEPQ